MKNYFIALLLVFSVLIARAQETPMVFKYRTNAISFKHAKAGETRFGKFEECDLVIVVNFNKHKIFIFSEEEQEFDIIEYGEWETDQDGDKYINMRAVDKDGNRCGLTIMKLVVTQDDQMQMYVRYSDVSYVYNMDLVN
jgi:hypothetical protein